MRFRFYCGVSFQWIALVSILLAVGCYEQPSAERLDYDPDTVEALRQEIESVDWDE